MSDVAKVVSIDAVKQFREGLTIFTDKVSDALTAADVEVRRLFDWVQDEIKIWQKEIVRRQNQLGEARVILNRKKLERMFGRKPDTTQEEKLVRRAKERLQEAEQTVEKLRRFGPTLQHAVTEYEGPARLLAGTLDGTMPKVLAQLSHRLDALDEYVRMLPPDAPRLSSRGSGGSGEPVPVPAAKVTPPAPLTEGAPAP
jgi:hypothetical protein